MAWTKEEVAVIESALDDEQRENLLAMAESCHRKRKAGLQVWIDLDGSIVRKIHAEA